MFKTKESLLSKVSWPSLSIHQFSLSSRNDPPVLGEDINTIEARQALSVINVKFLVILLLYKTEWSWELRAWSHKMNAIDTSTNSPHYFYWKRIGITNENLNCDVRVKALKSSLPNPLWDNKERECRWKLFRPFSNPESGYLYKCSWTHGIVGSPT